MEAPAEDHLVKFICCPENIRRQSRDGGRSANDETSGAKKVKRLREMREAPACRACHPAAEKENGGIAALSPRGTRE